MASTYSDLQQSALQMLNNSLGLNGYPQLGQMNQQYSQNQYADYWQTRMATTNYLPTSVFAAPTIASAVDDDVSWLRRRVKEMCWTPDGD